MDTDWIAIGEAADLLQVSRDTLRRWEKRGKIRSYRSPSNRRMYKRSEVLASYQEGPDEPYTSSPSTPITPPPVYQQNTNSPFTPYRPTVNTYTDIEHVSPSIPPTNTSSFQNEPQSHTMPVITPPITFTMSDEEAFTETETRTTTAEASATQQTRLLETVPHTLTPTISQPETSLHETISTPTPMSSTPIHKSTYNIPAFSYTKPNLSAANTQIPPNPINTTPSVGAFSPQISKTSYDEPIKTQLNPIQPLLNTPSIPVVSPSPIVTSYNPPTQRTVTSDNTFTPTLPSPLNNKFRILDLDISQETITEPPTGNLKILKVITAVLIAILIILGIAIFSIIFVQYS